MAPGSLKAAVPQRLCAKQEPAVASLFALGYAVDEIAASSVRAYFAQSLAIYCQDQQRLNIADPQIHKWFRSTLWSEAFWRRKERQEKE